VPAPSTVAASGSTAPAGAAPALFTRDFILLMTSTFALFSSFYFLMPVLPLYVSERLGGDQATIGMVASMFTVTAVVFRPIGGFLMDRFGRRGVHLLALLAFAIAVACYSLAGALGALILVRLFHGFPWGAANTAANTVAADLVPVERRGEGIGLFGMSQTLAMAVAPAAAIAIVGDDRFQLLFASAAGLAVLALLLGLPVRHPAVANPQVRLQIAKLLEGRVAWLAASLLFVTAGYGSVTTFVVVYAKELGVTNPGLFFTLLAAGLVLSRLTAGRLFDRHGPALVIGTGMALMGLCYVLLAAGRAGYYAAAIVLGMGFGAVAPSFQAMVPGMVPESRRGAAFATVLGSFDVGVGLGSYLLGQVARAMGYRPMYLIAGSLLLVSVWILLIKIAPAYARATAKGKALERSNHPAYEQRASQTSRK